MLKKLSTFLSAMLLSVTAFAVPVFQGNLTGPNASFAWTGSGEFQNFWTFTQPSTSQVGSSVTNVELRSGTSFSNRITNFAAFIDGLSFASLSIPVMGGTVTTLSFSGNLPAGIHQLQVSGNAGTQASFGGNLVVGAIPEPETYALMLCGLGAMIWVTRRRTV